MKCNVIGIDLAKNIFQVCGLGEDKSVLFNKRLKRSSLIQFLSQQEPTLVVMEACYSANSWGRRIEKLGHEVRCIPAFVVKPFVIGHKNDANDALAIAEASLRPKIRFVSIKSVEQQDIQSLQRIRELLIRQRTAIYNQIRGLLAEYGEVCAKTPSALQRALPDILEDAENELSSTARDFIARLQRHAQHLCEQIDELTVQLKSLVVQKEEYARLVTVPGVGPMVAATILASVNDIHNFKNGRQFASWIGLTPSQHSSGESTRLGKISKRGHQHLRRMLIHGARSVFMWSEKKQDNLSCWLQNLKGRTHNCKAVVALANKLARIIWVVLAHNTEFDVKKACA